MKVIADVTLTLGSLGVFVGISLLIKVGFRRGKKVGDPS